jgi:hypothetical protein
MMGLDPSGMSDDAERSCCGAALAPCDNPHCGDEIRDFGVNELVVAI